jgi:hypothetical protein
VIRAREAMARPTGSAPAVGGGHHRPGKLPAHSTWYLVTDLPVAQPPDPGDRACRVGTPVRAAQLGRAGYKQIKGELGWADLQVPRTGRSADLGAGLLHVFVPLAGIARRAACPARHVQLPGHPGSPPRATRGWRRACLWRALGRGTAGPRAPHPTESDGRSPSRWFLLGRAHQRRQALRTESNHEESRLLALGPSQQRPNQHRHQRRRRSADLQIASPSHQRALVGQGRTMGGEIQVIHGARSPGGMAPGPGGLEPGDRVVRRSVGRT